ncbi:MAG: D-alanyl-D-alanine carboxypeptidase [Oscillospiraceae bacterium]|jgi:D-alanyl-D-alanine carboxypeptidase (penicillin-binding protein 5/6)|nr:D-alanyl-D-alanine carboxypeptidase [Oscillospiraceae bacterium]
MKKIALMILIAALLASTVSAYAVEPVGEDILQVTAPSAVLMEKTSGSVLYEKNSHERLAPASVTKVMTLLLIMEEIAAGNIAYKDQVTCSSYAASMGGSQIWLEENEKMTVGDMVKAIAVVSANDCAVAMAERIAGSESAFVTRMNERAEQLGMADTHFMDCTGLTDDDNHYTSAYDIALMSRELLFHEDIKDYTTIWMDSLRGGESALTNTNKLVRFFDGATGLKTGFTKKAMYCLSASAMRDGTEYIAVVMHEQTSAERFESAKALLSYGFANFELCSLRAPEALPPVAVELGETNSLQPEYSGQAGMLVEKGAAKDLSYEIVLPESLVAPIDKGARLGEVIVRSGDEELTRVPLLAGSAVERLTTFKIYGKLLLKLFGK